MPEITPNMIKIPIITLEIYSLWYWESYFDYERILAKNHKIVLFEVKSQEYWKMSTRNSYKYDKVSNCHFRSGYIEILE